MLPIIPSIFLHFFDIHFLELKMHPGTVEGIEAEATLATRFALLLSREVLVPAASYFESELCRRVIDSYQKLFDTGIIWIVGTEPSLVAFCESKLLQYSKNSLQYNSYIDALKDNRRVPPFRTKRLSSTKIIASKWLQDTQRPENIVALVEGTGVVAPANLIENWGSVPAKLEHQAFIVPHVLPLLFGMHHESLTLRHRLGEGINKSYFSSYTSEFRSSVVTDLYYLGSEIRGHGEFDIPYGCLVNECRSSDILKKIRACHADNIRELSEDSVWTECVKRALQKFQSRIYNIDMEKVKTLRSFIVHGRDELLLHELKNYLQNTLLMPEPIVLKEQPSRGRTLIEKFEENADKVDVAIVLLTPDDVGALATGPEPADRARQNVIFELGYFVGKFGRRTGRVLLLHKGNLELPSDLAGVVYIKIDSTVQASGESIRKELAAIV